MSQVTDCGVLHSWASPLDLMDYLPRGWRSYVIDHLARPWHDHYLNGAPRPEGPIGATPMDYDLAYRNPFGDYVPGSVRPGSVAACSDEVMLREQHLDPVGISHALLCHGNTMLIPALSLPRLAIEFTKAINDWTVERWLARDERLWGTILVPTQTPEFAAAEIRRVGRNKRMAAVLLGANGLSKPFGHPAYNPIFEAAEELGLRIVVRSGGDETMESSTYPTAGGLPGTYAEYRALAPQPIMSHVASLICQGVTVRYPSLRFLLVGGSIGWVTPFLWRLDTDYKAMRHDMLWLDTMPSNLFYDKFLIGTHPFVFGAAGGQLAKYLAVDPLLAEVICYASGYPERECTLPDAVERQLPSGWGPKVLSGNANRFFGWTAKRASQAASGAVTV